MNFVCNSALETENLGQKLGERISKGTVIALFGDLGAGKTAFVRGLAKGLGITADVTSPTFALVNEYKSAERELYHFDMYRIIGWDSLYSVGYFDYVDTDAILAIEWSENIEEFLPDDCVRVTIRKTDDENERIINVEGGNIGEITFG